jgi:putative ABC transport system permease protein
LNHRTPFLESAKVAFDSLRSSKLRSFLTLLGVILATSTLIAVMSVIHGMDVYIAETVSDMGADGFRVVRMAFLGDFDPKKFAEYLKKNPQLSSEEYEFLKAHLTFCREFGMTADRGGKASYRGESNDSLDIQGGTANYGVITNTQVASGRFFSEADDRRHLPVAFLGWDLKEQFFQSVDPIGKTIAVDGHAYEVVGVGKPKGSVFGQSQDNYVILPMGTYLKVYSGRQGIEYMALARDRNVLAQAQDEARGLLRAFRHLQPKADDSFAILTSDALVGAWDQLTGAIAATAVAVVSVFMVVGGVVIMNIMLAVVTERTREIGIRKAVGARRADILNQFLVESALLSAMGGLIGVAIAWTMAVLVRNLTAIPMSMPISAVALGVGLSTAVGVFFGVYPARQAAKLDPIEALRAEA